MVFDSCLSLHDGDNEVNWQDVISKLKPGSHIVAISPSLQHHTIAAAIEDCGVEIRDCLLFLGQPSYMVCLARVPLEGTVVQNVLKHGTGGINIGECRVGTDERFNTPASPTSASRKSRVATGYRKDDGIGPGSEGSVVTGRYPANLLHDGSLDIVNSFPKAGGGFGVVGPKGSRKGGIMGAVSDSRAGQVCGFGDSGSAARFFFAIKDDCKLKGLTEYLARLITPSSGKILALGINNFSLDNVGFEVKYEI